MPAFEERYQDVLQNIEFALVTTYREQPKLTNHSALYAVETLIKVYNAEAQGRTAALPPFQPHEQAAYDSIKAICDWRLGHAPLGEEEGASHVVIGDNKTPEEIIACLKRIQRSIQGWTKRGGRRGYFDFVSQFIK